MVLKHALWFGLPALIAAHEGAGFPKIVGGPADLRSRNIFSGLDLHHKRDSDDDRVFKQHVKRANCGPGVGNCAANECCSSGGYVPKDIEDVQY